MTAEEEIMKILDRHIQDVAKEMCNIEYRYARRYFGLEILEKAVRRAATEYASQQRTEGIKEGFEAAREGSGFWEVDFDYDTVEDYLNSKK